MVSARPNAPGERVRVFVRARDVAISRALPEQTSVLNTLRVRVLSVHEERDPAHRLLRLAVELGSQQSAASSDAVLLARLTHKAVSQLALHPGQEVYAHVKSVALVE